MTLELSPEEVEVLRKVLEREIAEVGPELRHTATSTYHDELKHYKEVLIHISKRLAEPKPQ
ncbi:MAG: hypothetical protein IPM13_09445 [Phycisphaerales bacterium]|nr:hypothetical protein [Phycisphaerales bacterium]